MSTIKLKPAARSATPPSPGERTPTAGEPVIQRKRRVIVVPPQAAAAPAAPVKPAPTTTLTLKATQKPAAKPTPPAPEPVKAKAPAPEQKPLSRAEKLRRKAAKAAAALEVLKQHYPEAFGTVRPLAIGIREAVQAERKAGRLPLGMLPICEALRAWTNTDEYARALAAGGPRFNLAGEPEGEVSPENAASAAAKMERRAEARAKHEASKAKRKAQSEEQSTDTAPPAA